MEEYIEIEGGRLWTVREGQGEPILFCHGGPGLWDYLQPVSDMLQTKFTVLRYEQRGCGRSSEALPYTVDANVEDIETLRRYWNIEKWIIVGHSWGANLALAYVLKYPDRAKSVIYLCGTGITNKWNAEYKQNWSARLASEQIERLSFLKEKVKDRSSANWEAVDREYCCVAWSTDFADRGRAQQYAEKLLAPGRHPNYGVNDQVWSDWKEYIQQEGLAEAVQALSIPFLTVAGSEDPRPANYLKEFNDLLQNGVYVEIKDAGHYPWLEDYDAVKTALHNFLK